MRTTSFVHWFDHPRRHAGRYAFALALLAGADTANAQQLPAREQVAQATQPLVSPDLPAAVPRTVPLDSGTRLFFGYVEFDADPTAPGGVQGFAPYVSTHPTR